MIRLCASLLWPLLRNDKSSLKLRTMKVMPSTRFLQKASCKSKAHHGDQFRLKLHQLLSFVFDLFAFSNLLWFTQTLKQIHFGSLFWSLRERPNAVFLDIFGGLPLESSNTRASVLKNNRASIPRVLALPWSKSLTTSVMSLQHLPLSKTF